MADSSPSSIRKAVFPVAGLGTRFLPATKSIPKEMLPLIDRPVIDWAVSEAVASGLDQMLLVTSRGKASIEDYFDRSPELEAMLERRGKKQALAAARRPAELARFAWVRQPEALGLGHAVLMARELVGAEAFAVLLCDDVIDASIPCLSQMIAVYERYSASVVCVERVPHERTSSYGIVAGSPAGERVWRLDDLVEKPPPEKAPSDLGIIGRYILTPAVFEELAGTPRGSGGEIQLTDALKRLTRREPVYAYAFEGRRYDVGTREGFVEATIGLSLSHPDLSAVARRSLEKSDS